MNVAAIIVVVGQISIVLTVLSMGMRASFSDIANLLRRPGQLIRALISIYVIMPIVAILIVTIFTLNPVVEVVLVTLSVSPIPPLFPKTAIKSGGEASFIVGLLAVVALLAIVMIPLVFAVLSTVLGRDLNFSQWVVVKTLATLLLIPLAIGMALRHFAPELSERYAGLVGKIGGILLIVAVLPILIAILPAAWSLIGGGTLAAFILFALIGVTTGYFLGGPDAKDRSVLALGTASRHPGIAIALAGANAGDTPMKTIAAAVILYLIMSAIVSAPFLKWLSARNEKSQS